MFAFPAPPLRAAPVTSLAVLALAVLSVALSVTGPARAGDVEGSRDHPLVGKRYEGSEIARYAQSEFDEYNLLVKPITRSGGLEAFPDAALAVEGRVTRIQYAAPAGQSVAAVFRSYKKTLEAAGFETLFTCKRTDCGKNDFAYVVRSKHLLYSRDYRYLAARLPRPEEGDVYVSLFVGMADVGGGAFFKRVLTQLDVVEAEALGEKMVVVDAGEMARAIDTTGRVALYGIYFDTDKTEIRPESEETLEQIAKLLQDQGELKLVVVGHTDNQGRLDYNMDLSKRRAEAVKQALVADYGIAAGRLAAWGVGYLAPVASNRGEDGRAKNRRVELVEQ